MNSNDQRSCIQPQTEPPIGTEGSVDYRKRWNSWPPFSQNKWTGRGQLNEKGITPRLQDLWEAHNRDKLQDHLPQLRQPQALLRSPGQPNTMKTRPANPPAGTTRKKIP